MKALDLVLAFSLLSFLLVFPFSIGLSYEGENIVAKLSSRVHNLNTGQSYSTIQEAINAPETQDGNEIFVVSGTYYESITVNKSLSIVGEDRSSTIIDGNGAIKVVYVTADNVEIRNFTVQNGTFGLWLENSHNSRIIDNTFQDGSYGIRIRHSKGTYVVGNNVRKFIFFGVELDSSGNTTLRNNEIADNRYNFGVNGASLFDFMNNIDTSNIVNGKPVRYLINWRNASIDSATFQDLGYLALINSSNIRVRDLDVQNNMQGVLFAFTVNSMVVNVNAKSNWNGIYVTHSRNTTVSGNNANGNFDYGIKFFNSSRSVARNNNVDRNGWAGIGVFGSPNSTIDGNKASFNTYNLHVVYTNNSVITRNIALNKPGGYSIAVYYSHNNSIYHNTFENSLLFVETRNGTRFTPSNSWDNGLEGNYWTSYRGVDVDRNAIGDKPYLVGENNIDNFPLLGNYSDFIVTKGERTYSVSIISNSTISQFQFNSEDEKVSFTATDFSKTRGFSRVAVPNELIQALTHGNLTFSINGEQIAPQRKWADNTNTYWYFSYVNTVPESVINPWYVVAAVSFILVVIVLVFIVLKKKQALNWQLSKKRGEQSG